ncbi:hypothetical protein MZD04_gp202 [Pseudomonas phage Psa21]|uniref:DUF4376 domain-containing protein n=1 Tax=Pseudomonas phage Psa21 TaxID=2530023 RepID=A0A481W4X6_9CAUD|nr:hypothetical protein MZD04_gp202 [Pseudomonas phage Psa21]QBJ02728.1 hypothetical protein PSA21_202 [Pseudomonas phage Psa21]
MTIVTRTTRLIESDTGDYPVYLSDLSARVKNTLFPTTIDSVDLFEFGYEPVLDTEIPTGDVVAEVKPTLKDGQWYRTWTSREFTPTELSTNLSDAKNRLMAQAESFRVSQFDKGFPYEFNGEIYHVQIRTTDRQNISSIRVIAKEAIQDNRDLTINFRVYENVTIPLTAVEFVAMADTTFYRVTEGYQVAWTIKDQVNSATTLAELPVIPEELFSPVESFRTA